MVQKFPLKIPERLKAAGCSLGIGDWRILRLLWKILQLMFGSLWPFFIQMRSFFQNIFLWRYTFLSLLECFMKTLELLNFWNANHSTKSSVNYGSKVKWKEKFQEEIFENFRIPREVVMEIFENAFPFATGSCWKFKPKLSVEWKAPIMLRKLPFTNFS